MAARKARPRVRCPDGHQNTVYLGRDAYGNDVYECYGCERSRSKTEFKFVVPKRRGKRGR
jgi:hypothetical protein